MSKENKKENHLISRIVLGVLFWMGVMFCLMVGAGLLARSFTAENILSVIGFVIAVVLLVFFEIFLARREKNEKVKHRILVPVVMILVIFAVMFAMMFYQLDRSSSAAVLGKNINVCRYSHSVTDFGSRDLEGLIREKCGGTQAARLDAKEYHEVFFLSGNKITSYEFVEQGDRYFYIGKRQLIYGSAHNPGDSSSWQETVLADASANRTSHVIRSFRDGDSDPAWGVTSFDPAKIVQIRGKYPDQVKKLKTGSGSVIYLWIYNDLGDTADLQLKDVSVTGH